MIKKRQSILWRIQSKLKLIVIQLEYMMEMISGCKLLISMETLMHMKHSLYKWKISVEKSQLDKTSTISNHLNKGKINGLRQHFLVILVSYHGMQMKKIRRQISCGS